ncbi:dimethyl sulfoxide reductase anchor subunit family protein [Providencia manganoxydans]|uniref:dimethyl sulfoxide reductase anchor subunit family protein n=1 Tax=Providencia manganoxydans TaxID=2923283 RepID=UPI00280E48A7|nr:dimethyl sulfoxide reductase anchor subunit [Providencia stuartii]ELR5082202.1 dimethyl sulfoxide reductase anchor subunit [Providencia stuartii]
MNEWPLLLFTFLMQTSIGLTLMLVLSAKKLAGLFERGINRSFLLGYLFVGCVFAGIGLISSITHLGVPLNAPNSLLNIFSSWLSREVVLTATYFTFLGLAFLWVWFKKELSYPLLSLAAVAGLCDVYAMASIYRYTSMLVWMSDNTYLMFYGATFTLGAAGYYLLVNSLMKYSQKSVTKHFPYQWGWGLCTVISISLFIRLLYQPYYERYLADTSYHNQSITFPISSIEAYQDIASLRLVGWGIAIVAVFMLGYSLFRQSRTHMGNSAIVSRQKFLVLGCCGAIVGEFMLRYCFYYIHI